MVFEEFFKNYLNFLMVVVFQLFLLLSLLRVFSLILVLDSNDLELIIWSGGLSLCYCHTFLDVFE